MPEFDNYQVTPIRGMNELIPQPLDSCYLLQNFTSHPRTHGWDDRIGYEPYLSGQTTWSPFVGLGRIDSICVWSEHSGAREMILFECEGALYQFINWGDNPSIQQIGADRPVPAPNEPTSTFTPFGRFLIIVDGRADPIKYEGWPFLPTGTPYIKQYPLGWGQITPSPQPWNVETDPSDLTSANAIGIWAGLYSPATERGLGSKTGDTVNSYRWKCTFINNAGAESPISKPSNRIEWTTPSAGTFDNNKFVVGMEIPTGPIGTLARRIYRTKNLGDDTSVAEVYYFVDEIPNNCETFYYDHYADNQLGSVAPQDDDSIIFPAHSARFSAMFKGCLFIDGGSSSDTTIYWSVPNKPDQFQALDFASLGGRETGGITGLYSYTNFLVILRERGVDMVRGDPANGFSIVPLTQSLGSRAVHTLATIPGLGVVFLAADGVYLIDGSFDAGGELGIKKLTDSIQRVMDRINPDVIARSYGVYSHKWGEYHCYFAVDGSDRPNFGVVLHTDRGDWSVREGFPISCIATDYNGNLIFGHNEGDVGNTPQEAGLFVVSRRRALGQTRVNVGTEENPIYELQDNTAPTSIFKSPWIDFGDPTVKKHIHSVTLYTMTMGDNGIALSSYADYGYVGVTTPQYRLQRPDKADQYVYGTARIDGITKWEEEYLTQVRFDVDIKESSHYQFEISTTQDIVIVGYSIIYTLGKMKEMRGKRVL